MPTVEQADRQPLWKRVGWLVLIWCGSVFALGLVGLALRAWLRTG